MIQIGCHGGYDPGLEEWYGLDESELGELGEEGYDPAGEYWYRGW